MHKERNERNIKIARYKFKVAKQEQEEIHYYRKDLNATKKDLKREGVTKTVSKATCKPEINNYTFSLKKLLLKFGFNFFEYTLL